MVCAGLKICQIIKGISKTKRQITIRNTEIVTRFVFIFLKRERLGMWPVLVRSRGCIGSCWGNRREGDHWGDLGIDGWKILGWISRRWDVGIWTRLGWPKIERGGGRL